MKCGLCSGDVEFKGKLGGVSRWAATARCLNPECKREVSGEGKSACELFEQLEREMAKGADEE